MRGGRARFLVEHPGIDKIAFTGSTEVGAASGGPRPAPASGCRSSWAQIAVRPSSRTRSRKCRRGCRRRHLVQPGSGLLCRLAPPGAGRHRAAVPEQVAVPDGIIAVWAISRQSDRYRRHRGPRATGDDHPARRAGQAGGSQGLATLLGRCPACGCFYPPTLVDAIAPACEITQVEVFGASPCTMTSHADRRWHWQQTRPMDWRLASGAKTSAWRSTSPVPSRRAQSGSTPSNLFDAASGFGGLPRSGFGREGGREGLFEYLRPAGRQRSLASGARELRSKRQRNSCRKD